jgi:hypothetical protein
MRNSVKYEQVSEIANLRIWENIAQIYTEGGTMNGTDGDKLVTKQRDKVIS